ncbi:MAG: hypothetical protein HC828_01970 [Blastochloris sp.]|nr:hypothetical protein [Blastochloris sp.]
MIRYDDTERIALARELGVSLGDAAVAQQIDAEIRRLHHFAEAWDDAAAHAATEALERRAVAVFAQSHPQIISILRKLVDAGQTDAAILGRLDQRVQHPAYSTSLTRELVISALKLIRACEL